LEGVKENLQKEKEKKLENQNNKREKVKKILLENKKKGQKIMNKLGELEKRQIEMHEKRHQELLSSLERQHQKYLNFLKNKEDFTKKNREKNLNILKNQQSLIGRAQFKENSVIIDRLNAHERTVLTQMELDDKLIKFYSQMNSLKEQSVMKMNKEQKKQLYDNLVKQEEEKKKKENEEKEKLANMN
jgi:hypothetical protein